MKAPPAAKRVQRPTERGAAREVEPKPGHRGSSVERGAASDAASAGADDPEAVWARVRELAADSMSSTVLLPALRLERLSDDRAVVRVTDPAKVVYAQSQRGRLEELLRGALGGRRVVVEISEPEGSGDRAEVDSSAQQRALQNPLVRRAMELFDARLVDVERDAPEGPGGSGE